MGVGGHGEVPQKRGVGVRPRSVRLLLIPVWVALHGREGTVGDVVEVIHRQ